jgi:osmotically-inducible protein OsmY
MKTTKQCVACLFVLMLSIMTGCAASPPSETTGQYIDDAAITTKVKTAIFNEPTLKSTEIKVETYKGVVQLSGFVESQQSESKAVELAQNVSGVKSVKNDMRLKE